MIDNNSMTTDPLSEAMRVRLRDLRARLLTLHKALLDSERVAYERVHGAVSAGEMLQLAIGHEQFAWLHPISELIVRIDELMAVRGPKPTETDGLTVIAEARRLLSPADGEQGFAGRYNQALQRDPAAVLEHREIKRLLS